MTNGQNVARARHLEDVANASKRYILAEILDVTNAVASELENLGGLSVANFTGATSIAGGLSGLVPAPSIGDENKFLRGDGSWANVSNGVLNTVASSVDGGIWYEFSDGVPVLKLHNNGTDYTFANALTAAPSANNYLSVRLKFNQSTTRDECGHTFTAVGSPSIVATNAVSGYALQVDTNDHVICTDGISLGGQDFTVDCWFRCETSVPYCTEIFYFGQSETDTGTRLALGLTNGNSIAFALGGYKDGVSYDAWRTANGILVNDTDKHRNKRFHGALVYRHDEQKMYGYLSGKCFRVEATTMFQSAINYPVLKVGGGHKDNTQFVGTVDEFRIHNGIALWTSDFTPPTAADYA